MTEVEERESLHGAISASLDKLVVSWVLVAEVREGDETKLLCRGGDALSEFPAPWTVLGMAAAMDEQARVNLRSATVDPDEES